MDNIPPLAWLAIAFIVVILIGVNVSLFSLLRSGGAKPPTSRTVRKLQKATEKLRHPYKEEQKQLEELSQLVQQLKTKEEQQQTEDKE
jgi:hypothetical protein